MFGEKPWSVTLLPDGASTAREILLGDAGAFAWHLPAGGYTIVGFHGIVPGLAGQHISGRIAAHFALAAATATDIGTLTLALAGLRYRMAVGDAPLPAPADLPAGIARRHAPMRLETQR